MWRPISTAPFDRDLELAVHDKDGHHALVFPCRRIPGGWMHAEFEEVDRREPDALVRMGRKALNQRFTFFGASFSSLRSAMVLSVPIVLTSVSDYRLILDERGVRVKPLGSTGRNGHE